MITFHNYEGKNLETLKNTCLEELNVSLDQIYFKEEEIESGLFKSKKVILEAITKDEIISSIKKFIKELATNFNIEINSEIKIENNSVSVILVSNNNNILIGKDGRTMNAIQVIMRQTFSKLSQVGLKLNIDIGNYRAKKQRNLEYEIKKICREVLNTKVEVKLDPMNSFERRLVHSIASEFEGLQSVSEGIEPERYTIIKIKD